MNFVRQLLAVFLSVYLSSPAWATEKKSDPKKENDYHFFKLGVRPIDPSGSVDWEKECVVVLTDHSPKVRLQYKKADGTIGTSNFGNVRKGVEVIVDGKTGYALRLRVCGNGIVEPKNWEPVGEELCKEDPPVTKTVEVSVPPNPAPVSFAPQFDLGLKPEDLGAKKIKLEEQKPVIDSQPKKAEAAVGIGDKDKKKSKTWLYVLVGAAAAGILVALAGGGSSGKKSTGGPAGDPRN